MAAVAARERRECSTQAAVVSMCCRRVGPTPQRASLLLHTFRYTRTPLRRTLSADREAEMSTFVLFDVSHCIA